MAGLLAVLGWKAVFSPIAAAGALDLVLIVFALAGYLIGRAQDARHSRVLMGGLLAVVACSVTVATIQWSVPDWNPIYAGRPSGFPSGFFAHYNHAANFSLGAAGLFFSAVLRGKGISKAFSAFGFVASVLMVLLSLSRGGNLALACVALTGLILFSTKLKHRGSSPLLLWAAVVTGCIVVGPLVSLAVQRVAGLRGNVIREGGFADGGRLSFYDAAWKLFLERPVTGGGAGSFGRDVYQVLPADFNLAAEPEMAHNELLQLLGDYGAPCALLLVILLIVPIIRQCTRYQLGRSSGGGAWESLGLLGMLIQSNFDFVFHVAPCAFLAALILGRICRQRRLRASGSEWDQIHGVSRLRAEEYYEEARAAEAQGVEAFAVAARSYACASLAGRKRAEFRLIVLLLSSKDEIWQRHGNDLILREKMRDGKGMAAVMRRIVEDCGTGGEVRPQDGRMREVAESSRQSGWVVWFRSLGVMVVALVLVATGARLTEFSLALWKPIYHPDGMSPARRFEALMLVQEKAPFLGNDRKALEAFIEQLYEFSTLEAREFWAASSYRRLLNGSVAAEHDPVVALQLATVAGWAGEEEQALALYDRAIHLQAVHERIFMAHFFKAEYFQDLMLSSADEGKLERSRKYAQLASENFRRSLELAPFGGVHHMRRRELMDLCDQALSAGSP
jgi:O-antigen ligase